jgi:O-antigen/teichoic acid export membrane protein
MTTEETVQATPLESPLASWRTVLRSFGLLAASETIARLVSFAAILWMTRKLSLDGFGLVALGGNLVVWFAVIVNSTQSIGLRDAAREPQRFKEITEPQLGVRLALAVAGMVALAVTAIVIGDSAEDREVLLLFLLILPVLSLNLRFSVLAVGSAKAVAAGNVISQVLYAAGVFLFVTGPDDAIYVPISQALSELTFAGILVAAIAPRVGFVMPRIDRPAWREHITQSAPLMVVQASRGTINWYDSFLIALVLGQAQVGLYSAAYKPILFTTYSIGLLFTSFFAGYNAARSERTREMLLSHTVRLSTTLSVPITIVLSAGSPLIVTLLFGEAYSDAAGALAILAWTIPILAGGSCFGLVLISHRRQALSMRHTLVAVAFNVGANFLAVPVFGINGAAAVTVTSILLITWLNYRSCIRFGYTPPLPALLKGGWRLRPATGDADSAAAQGNSPTG